VRGCSTCETLHLKRDQTCHDRTLERDQSVWYRTPGLSEALEPAWQGPYVVDKVLGGLSYRIHMHRKYNNVHVNFLKEDMSKSVKRITTVIEDDTLEDEVTCTNGKMQIEKIELFDEMEADIKKWIEEFGDVICSEPGLTNRVELSINMGDVAAVLQRP